MTFNIPHCPGISATALFLGDLHACALVAGGSVMCWGRNDYGQLGNGSTSTSYTPTKVFLGNGMYLKIRGGKYLKSKGILHAWFRINRCSINNPFPLAHSRIVYIFDPTILFLTFLPFLILLIFLRCSSPSYSIYEFLYSAYLDSYFRIKLSSMFIS